MILPFRRTGERVPSVRRVRSTLVVASLQAIKRRGLFETYLTHLPAIHHGDILSCIAGTWLPLSFATAHYEAIDALGLTDEQVTEMGIDVSRQAQQSYMATVAKLATSAGVTPWTAIKQFQRMWDWTMDGGDVAVFKEGPKDARVEVVGFPLLRIRYLRLGFRYYMVALCRLFSSSCYANENVRGSGPTWVSIRIAWA